MSFNEKQIISLLDISNCIIFKMILNPLKIDYINIGVEKVTGYIPSDFYNDPNLFRKIIHPDWKDYFDRAFNDLLNNKNDKIYEF